MTRRSPEDNRRSWWEECYRAGRTGWDQGRPNPAVPEAARFFQTGSRVLVPGCGFGHDAAELARLGFAVEGWDLSASAIRGARQRYDLSGLRFEERDLFDSEVPVPRFDAIFEHTFLCAVGPSFYEETARRYDRLLTDGGKLFAILFTGLVEEDPPPWKIAEAAVREIFGKRFEILSSENSRLSFPHRCGEETLWRMRKRPGS